jgi:hypothetical protein
VSPARIFAPLNNQLKDQPITKEVFMQLQASATFKLFMVFLFLAALSLHGAPSALAKATHQESNVYRFADGSPVAGATATLTRNKNGATVNVRTQDLEPLGTYTLWWVVFNDPAKCTPPGCGEDDIFNPDGTPNMEQIENVGITVLFAAGNIAGKNGRSTFAGRISEGPLSKVILGEGYLADAETAEFHMVVRNHGQPIPGLVHEQIRTFDGGCDINECVDEQFAVFLAP